MFPPSGAQIYRNEAGEPLGWDMPSEPDYCDVCGISYMGADCPGCAYDPDEYEPDDDDFLDLDELRCEADMGDDVCLAVLRPDGTCPNMERHGI